MSATALKKPPDQLRVTLKEQNELARDAAGHYIDDGAGGWVKISLPPLGFANAYEPNLKAYEKRAETQNSWAYGSNCFTDHRGRMVKNEGRWERDSNDQRIFVKNEQLVSKNLQPVIIDNIPVRHFRIQKSVSRYSTSNKVWRILDPRGFELEISTDCMEDLLMEGDIQRGEILGFCQWRTGKILVRV